MSIDSAPEEFAAPTALNPREYVDVLVRRKLVFVLVFVVIFATGAVVTSQRKPVYQTEAKLLIATSAPALRPPDPADPIAPMMARAQPDAMATQIQVLQSRPFLEEAKRAAGMPSRTLGAEPTVTIETVPDSAIIRITVEGQDAREITNLANAIVDLHVARTDLAETAGFNETMKFVQRAKAEAAHELAAAGARLTSFRRKHEIVRLAAERDAEAKEYAQLQTDGREAERNIATAEAKLAAIQRSLTAEPVDHVRTSVKENPLRAKLVEKLNDLKIQRADLQREFQPTSRRIQDQDREIAEVQRQLEAEPETLSVRTREPNPNRARLETRLMDLRADLQGYQTEYKASRAQISAHSSEAESVGPWEVEDTRLAHERDAAERAYEMWASRLRDLEIRSKGLGRGARAIERAAAPMRPSQSRKTKYLALSIAAALFLAAGAVFARELLDGRLHSPGQVERIAALPKLGHIPAIESEQPRLLLALPSHSPLAEPYRLLRVSIGFDEIESPVRRLLVTSPAADEGKTTTAANLATALAMDGKKVILVDADFRRPSLDRLFNRPSTPGLSEVLQGLQSVDEVVQETTVENLRVICAGSIPPNPVALLGTRSFDALVAQLETRADIIIFDSPPCLPVTDALLLAARMDGVVLVVHIGKSYKDAVQEAVGLLIRARAPILGVVANGVREDKSGYYHRRECGSRESDDAERVRGGEQHPCDDHVGEPQLQNVSMVQTGSRLAGEAEE